MAGNIYKLNLRLSDGSTIDAGNFEAPEGPRGDTGVLYGTCTTSSITAAKVATVAGFSLFTGACVAIKFTNYNSQASPTLNVNETGAKSIRAYVSTAAQTYTWRSGEVVMFVYDGTYWCRVDGSIASTQYYGMTKLNNSINSTSSDEAATADAVRRAYELANSKADPIDLTLADEGSVLVIQEESVVPAPKSDVICGCTNMTDEQKAQARANIGAESISIVVTLTASEWTIGSDGRYYQTVSANNVKATTPVVTVDVALTGEDLDADATILTAWAGPSANNVIQGEGTLTFHSYELPSVNIPLNVGVV